MSPFDAFVLGVGLSCVVGALIFQFVASKLAADAQRLLASSTRLYEAACDDACKFARKAAEAQIENTRLRRCLQGITSCSTCGACNGAARSALKEAN